MSNKSIKIKNVNLSGISLSEKTKYKGVNFITVNYQNKPLYFQTDYLEISDITPSKNDQIKILEIKSNDSTYKFIDSLELKIEELIKTKKNLFNKNNITTQSIIKDNKLKFPVNLTEIKLFDTNNEYIDSTELNNYNKSKLIIETKLWLTEDTYGLYLKIHKMMLKNTKPPVEIIQPDIQFDSSDEENNEEKYSDPPIDAINFIKNTPFINFHGMEKFMEPCMNGFNNERIQEINSEK